MKRIISIALCACFLAISVQGQETKPIPKDDVTLCEVAFVLAIMAMAGVVVIKIYGQCPSQHDKVTVYIDESKDGRATWTCIATNGPITLNGRDPLEIFRAQLTNDLNFYRARVKRCVTP